MSAPDDNKGAMLVLNLLEALTGFAANGARNSDLTELVKTSAPNITRTMAVLIAKGWARKADNGRFYPTPLFTQLSFRVLADFDRLETRVADNKRSMTGY
jgi:DNA-binding IclR family transcriptional regulator